MTAEQFEGRPDMAVRAFPETLEWFNVAAPLTIEDLRGKVVILDFWTYGCINCIHMIPVLGKIEEKYPDEVVVIGVHSAKFTNEGEHNQLREIIQRYDLQHPVINDKEFQMWQAFQVQAWPTFAVIDPRGNLLAMQGGEIPFEGFDQLVGGMIAHFDSLGEMNREPISALSATQNQPDRLLRYPGKVLVDAEGGRLFIADSGHHRIVVLDLETHAVLDVIGSGQRGYADDGFDVAQFHSPQGMALKNDLLYVADTNNHAVRSVDFETRTVRTLAGTGYMGVGIMTFGTKIREPRAFDLRSPWDVVSGAGDTLFVAMAGTHQIAEINLQTRLMRVSVGNGREALHNDTLGTSELAQPSGLYFEDGLLYFADSESSSIRVADFTNDTVRTLAGPIENNLFAFGDVDGQIGTSRLQHPLGITGDGEGNIYVADTYNSKIKVIDAATNSQSLLADVSARGFNEPGGLDFHAGKLYVADTNNHMIRVVDLAENTITSLEITEAERLIPDDRPIVMAEAVDTIRLPQQALNIGEGTLQLQVNLPEGYTLNPDAPSQLTLIADTDAVTLPDAQTRINTVDQQIPVIFAKGTATLSGQLTLYYCEAKHENLCFMARVNVKVPVVVGIDNDSADVIQLAHTVALPELRQLGSIS